jgi:hypothetical protein
MPTDWRSADAGGRITALQHNEAMIVSAGHDHRRLLASACLPVGNRAQTVKPLWVHAAS